MSSASGDSGSAPPVTEIAPLLRALQDQLAAVMSTQAAQHAAVQQLQDAVGSLAANSEAHLTEAVQHCTHVRVQELR